VEFPVGAVERLPRPIWRKRMRTIHRRVSEQQYNINMGEIGFDPKSPLVRV